MRYAIHIMRDFGPFAAAELAATYMRRGVHDIVGQEARDLLSAAIERGQGDFVIVRLVTSGVEVFRYRPTLAELPPAALLQSRQADFVGV